MHGARLQPLARMHGGGSSRWPGCMVAAGQRTSGGEASRRPLLAAHARSSLPTPGEPVATDGPRDGLAGGQGRSRRRAGTISPEAGTVSPESRDDFAGGRDGLARGQGRFRRRAGTGLSGSLTVNPGPVGQRAGLGAGNVKALRRGELAYGKAVSSVVHLPSSQCFGSIWRSVVLSPFPSKMMQSRLRLSIWASISRHRPQGAADCPLSKTATILTT